MWAKLLIVCGVQNAAYQSCIKLVQIKHIGIQWFYICRYAFYSTEKATDPVGPSSGTFKVRCQLGIVRGPKFSHFNLCEQSKHRLKPHWAILYRMAVFCRSPVVAAIPPSCITCELPTEWAPYPRTTAGKNRKIQGLPSVTLEHWRCFGVRAVQIALYSRTEILKESTAQTRRDQVCMATCFDFYWNRLNSKLSFKRALV